MMRYATTFDFMPGAGKGASLTGNAPAPVAPSGDGWEMTGATSVMIGIDLMLLWFWRQEKGHSVPCSACGAMARKGTRCLGCGTQKTAADG
jgi:hypothetical protein